MYSVYRNISFESSSSLLWSKRRKSRSLYLTCFQFLAPTNKTAVEIIWKQFEWNWFEFMEILLSIKQLLNFSTETEKKKMFMGAIRTMSFWALMSFFFTPWEHELWILSVIFEISPVSQNHYIIHEWFLRLLAKLCRFISSISFCYCLW